MSSVLLGFIDEILSRLPVKSLLRFKFVSKSWKSIIESPYFVKLHLERSINSEFDLNLITLGCQMPCRRFADHHPALAEIKPTLSSPVFQTPLGVFASKIQGCCNGLLALKVDGNETILFNPSTRKHHTLPKPLTDLSSHGTPTHGLGFDPLSDDYKFVRIKESAVRVYSLKNHNWKRIGDFPYILERNPLINGVFAGNALHWIVVRSIPETESFIVALDLALEKYREVPFPKFINEGFVTNMVVLGGCLSIVHASKSTGVDIWVMKEYCVAESWTKLMTLTRDMLGTFSSVLPLIYSRDNDEVLLLMDYKTFVWYNLTKKQARELSRAGSSYLLNIVACVGTLFSPRPGASISSTSTQ